MKKKHFQIIYLEIQNKIECEIYVANPLSSNRDDIPHDCCAHALHAIRESSNRAHQINYKMCSHLFRRDENDFWTIENAREFSARTLFLFCVTCMNKFFGQQTLSLTHTHQGLRIQN